MKSSFIFVFIFSLSGFAWESHALKCYTCTKTPNSGDDACVDDVESLGKAVITNCAKKYCTIFRQELLDPAGKVNSFTRGCEDEPIFLDHVETDPQFKVYYRSCIEELCNDWDAVNYGNNANNPDRAGGANFVAKGIENGAIQATQASITVLIMFSLFPAINKLIQ